MASTYAIASGIYLHPMATGFAIAARHWPTFPPKETDKTLLQTLEEIHVWTDDNGRQLKKDGSAVTTATSSGAAPATTATGTAVMSNA